MKVLITGANGQLGRCIKDASIKYPGIEFIFASRADLDIDEETSVETFFSTNKFDYCINTAAYTNVDEAESDSENAFKTNAEGVKYLALQCKKADTTLIQISTDYVFDGEKNTPYTEEDQTNPINVYGASKLKGEQYVQEISDKYFILRTSWLYSQYGHNFYNTVLRFSKEEKPLTVTTEQKGTPTNANDLADVILKIINSKSNKYSVYHVSNSGEATWYDFAKEILFQNKHLDSTILGKTDYYRTFAARPIYSVLDTKKLSKNFSILMVNWKKSLTTII